MAELCGLTSLLWLSGMLRRRPALCILIPAVAALLLSQTRTAVLGLIAGLAIGSLSLIRVKRRVRRALTIFGVVLLAAAVPVAPVVKGYLNRGQTSAQVNDLSGRTKIWPLVLSEPRPELNKIFGSGLSNGGVENQPDPNLNGLPIDGSWIATYQDQGAFGDLLEGLIFVFLFARAVSRPPGPTRALALFLITYCLIASFTETGMGEASPYLLDLTLAASLLVPRSAHTLPVGMKDGQSVPTADR